MDCMASKKVMKRCVSLSHARMAGHVYHRDKKSSIKKERQKDKAKKQRRGWKREKNLEPL